MVPTVIKHPGYPSLRVLMWPSYHHHDYEHFQHKIMPISSEHNHHCHPHQHDVVLFRTEEAVQQTAAVLSQLVALTGGRKVDIMIIIIIMLTPRRRKPRGRLAAFPAVRPLWQSQPLCPMQVLKILIMISYSDDYSDEDNNDDDDFICFQGVSGSELLRCLR